MKITVPIILKVKCIIAALLAVIVVPTLASNAVTQVPMLSPNNIGRAASIGIRPCKAKACNIPIVALLLCTIAVKPRPVNTPSIGLCCIASINSLKAATSLKGFIASLIAFIPENKSPKPKRNSPSSLYDLLLVKSIKATPIIKV